MKVEVIGYKGVVGGATYELMSRLGYEVTGSDKGDEVNRADIYLICVPEDFVEDVVNNLVLSGYIGLGGDNLVVVRSTTPPGTLSELMKRYNTHICHWPEHLREATALWDCYFPDFISIGECCLHHGDLLTFILRPIGMQVLRCDVTTSEATKYAINCFKCTVISFWNEFYELSQRMNFNPHTAARIAAHDHVIPIYGTILGKAYGGRCLPKDMRTLIETCEQIGYEPKLLKAVEELNNRIRDEWGESQIKTG